MTGGRFVMAIPDSLDDFDPYHTNIVQYQKLAYDSLVNLRPNGTFVSGIAEKWTTDVNGATFSLRSDVTCSDGATLRASQVAADLAYLSNPKNQSVQYGVTIPTVPFTVTADDGTGTVRIAMQHPYGFILGTIGQAPIVCAKGLENPAALKSSSDGTGPFVVSKVVPGQSITLTVRKNYAWGPGGATTAEPGTPASVVLRSVSDPTTSANLLLSGAVNFTLVGSQDQQRLAARGLDKVTAAAPGAVLLFNHRSGLPAADQRVRQALVSALDRDQVAKVSTGGTGGTARGLITIDPNPCPGDTLSGQLPKHDVAAAASILRRTGAIRLDLHFLPTQSAYEQPTAELIAQQWQAAGVSVNLIPDSSTSYTEVLFKTSNWDAYLLPLGFNSPDQIVPFLSGPNPPAGTNVSDIHNDTYDSLAAKAAATALPAACAMWNDAERALWHNVDLAPISVRPRAYYLKGAQAQVAGYSVPVPTSIRVLG